MDEWTEYVDRQTDWIPSWTDVRMDWMDGWTAHRRIIGLTGMFIYDTFTGPVISVGWIEMPLEMTDGLMSRVWMDIWTDWKDGRPDRLNGCIVWMDRWTDGGTNRQIGQTVILSDGQTERWMDRPNGQTDGQIDRQINIRADSMAGWTKWTDWLDRWRDKWNE